METSQSALAQHITSLYELVENPAPLPLILLPNDEDTVKLKRRNYTRKINWQNHNKKES